MKFILLSTTVTFLLATLVSASPIAPGFEMDHSPVPDADDPTVVLLVDVEDSKVKMEVPIKLNNQGHTDSGTLNGGKLQKLSSMKIKDARIEHATGGVRNTDILCQAYGDTKSKERVRGVISGYYRIVYDVKVKIGSFRCWRKG
jgi:hypothetical protein